ncbi:uncharacterized protein Tco025E_06693 [Trypanosoma conorhini]|uniref:Uncharacterized protein n=1 Tax=Trypanosoma conorhini TaxID=83891 RepID=A0A422NZZ7_9TRYP|nr:uncharacterized protein Tco025E_06693 [Trypanosoma conorhini]RNF11009.1 hypothetical protein Tco025E_06693 [Trypanosoma conorhini]
MPRAHGIPLPANLPRSGEAEDDDDDDELVRQLVEAADVDAVIERMELQHQRRLSPIVQGLKPFSRPPRREPRPAARGQPRHQPPPPPPSPPPSSSSPPPPPPCETRLSAPLRSPAGDAGLQGNHGEPVRGVWAPPPPTAGTSPASSVCTAAELRRWRLDFGAPPPPLRSPRPSDEDASSAPHENDHTEKPSVNRRHRAREHRAPRMRPPIESPALVNSPPPPPPPPVAQGRRAGSGAQQRRRYGDRHRAPSPGESPHYSARRQLDLQRSYCELSSIRGASLERPARRSQSARGGYYDRYYDPNFRGDVYRRAPALARMEAPSRRRRSASPPAAVPALSPAAEEDAWTQHTGMGSCYDRRDYWGYMGNGFEGTPTATTEEAHTPDDVDYDEEEYGAFAAVPPRIIEREQHLRSRVVEPPLTNSDAAAGSADGRGKAVEQEPAASEENNTKNNYGSHGPTYTTHSVQPRSPHYLDANGAGASNKVLSPSDQETTHAGPSLSSLAATPRERATVEAQEQGKASNGRSESWSHPQALLARGPSTVPPGSDEHTLRPDNTAGRQGVQRISPALSPTRQRDQRSAAQSPRDADPRDNGNGNRNPKRDRKEEAAASPGHGEMTQHTHEQRNPRAVARGAGKEKKVVSPSRSNGEDSSDSYTYSSYTCSSDGSLGMEPLSIPAAAAEVKPKNIPKSASAAVGPLLRAKAFPPPGPSVHPPPTNQEGKRVKQPTPHSHCLLQQRQISGPPPPPGFKMASAAPFRPSLQNSFLEIHSDNTPDLGFVPMAEAASAYSFSKRSYPRERPVTGASRPDASLRSVSRSTASRMPYVSYLPHSLLGPERSSVPVPKPLPTQTVPQGQHRGASVPASITGLPIESQEIVWRTSDGGRVEGKKHHSPSAVKAALTRHDAFPQPRSMSLGTNPPPPSRIPLRARNSISEMRSSSVNRVVEVPQRRPSREASLAVNQQPRSSIATYPGSAANAYNTRDETNAVQTVVIQLPYKAR